MEQSQNERLRETKSENRSSLLKKLTSKMYQSNILEL